MAEGTDFDLWVFLALAVFPPLLCRALPATHFLQQRPHRSVFAEMCMFSCDRVHCALGNKTALSAICGPEVEAQMATT